MSPLICESFSIVYTEVLHGPGWLDPRLQRNLGYGGTLDTEGQLKVLYALTAALFKGQLGLN